MKALSFILSVALLSAIVGLGTAWGPQGHQISARVAQHFLTPNAWEACQIINGRGVTLEEVSTSADDYSHSGRGRWSSADHYINVPKEYRSINMGRDCADNRCVIAAISNYTNILKSKKPEKWIGDEPSALTFLIHYVADAHQPLHAGYKHDRGGNDVKVKVLNKSYNLHSAWDSGIIKTRGKNIDQLFAEVMQFINNNPSLVARWRRDAHPITVGNESYTLVMETVYDFKNNLLDEAYIERNWPHIISRIAAAGVRLSEILNTIF